MLHEVSKYFEPLTLTLIYGTISETIKSKYYYKHLKSLFGLPNFPVHFPLLAYFLDYFVKLRKKNIIFHSLQCSKEWQRSDYYNESKIRIVNNQLRTRERSVYSKYMGRTCKVLYLLLLRM